MTSSGRKKNTKNEKGSLWAVICFEYLKFGNTKYGIFISLASRQVNKNYCRYSNYQFKYYIKVTFYSVLENQSWRHLYNIITQFIFKYKIFMIVLYNRDKHFMGKLQVYYIRYIKLFSFLNVFTNFAQLHSILINRVYLFDKNVFCCNGLNIFVLIIIKSKTIFR